MGANYIYNDRLPFVPNSADSPRERAIRIAKYGAAKAAVIHFAKGFSNDLLDRKIRANVISPGTTDTPVFDRFVPVEQLEAVKKYWADVMPIGTIGQPSDIGKTAVFLASDDSSFMLGAELLVDGGLSYLSR